MTRTLNGCLIKHFINRLIKADDRREYRIAAKILYSRPLQMADFL